MQNLNSNQQQAGINSLINQGFDFQSFRYEDFALVFDAVANSQSTQPTTSQSQEYFFDWNSSVVNPFTDIDVNHVNPQSQNHFLSWNSSTINSQTDVADIHVNPQSQEHFIWWNSSADEIFNGLPDIDQPQSMFASEHLFSDKKAFSLESNKERLRSKYALELGSREDDTAVISEEKFNHKKNKRPRKNEMHNQTEKNRRNAIKEKIHTLGGLLPNCTKTDQASILSDAVDHVKSLLCQRQMLSMTGHPMWLPGVQNNITQQIPQYMPYTGMDMVNMYGGGTSLPFLSFPSVPIPNIPILSESSIVSYPQLQVPPPPLSPTQVKPTSTTTFNTTNAVVQPQRHSHSRFLNYTINLANQGESSTSQYNAKETMDHKRKVPTLSKIYKVMASGTTLPQSGP